MKLLEEREVSSYTYFRIDQISMMINNERDFLYINMLLMTLVMALAIAL